MREAHRLRMKAWSLEDLAERVTDEKRAEELRREADRLRIEAVNEQEVFWKPIHTVVLVSLGIIIVLCFAAMCADVIAGMPR